MSDNVRPTRTDELTGLTFEMTDKDLAYEAMLKDSRVIELTEQLQYGLCHPLEYANAIYVIGQEYKAL